MHVCSHTCLHTLCISVGLNATFTRWYVGAKNIPISLDSQLTSKPFNTLTSSQKTSRCHCDCFHVLLLKSKPLTLQSKEFTNTKMRQVVKTDLSGGLKVI